MEKQSKYLIIILLAFVVCISVFWYQYNNNVSTFIMINETEVAQNGSFSGMLVDAYGQGVANKIITYHKPGYQMGTLVDVTTTEDGSFTINNAQYLDNASDGNYYGDFTFAGDGKYKECRYEGNVTVVAKWIHVMLA